MKKFSIIAVDYEFHVPRPGMKQGLNSLLNQTFDDYELLIAHDGPKGLKYQDEFDLTQFKNKPIVMNTNQRYNDWGHTLRDTAMKLASGEYFFHFNIDNQLYPNCLETISQKIDDTSSSVVIFSIKHFKAAGDTKFTGLPPTHCHIDAIQLVAHRNVWKNIGYWYNKETTSDGIIYERICNEYPYVHIDEILAENY